ncbi:MAG: hypothetical protein HY901_24145, partial [Deltaproteobacteria bacterium]|nr:hypothetical protein [Deltaproteobacteria bacterium]
MEVRLKQRLEGLLSGALGRAPLEAMLKQLGPLAERRVGSLTSSEVALCMRSVALALRVCCPESQSVDSARRRVEAVLVAEASSPPALVPRQERPATRAPAPGRAGGEEVVERSIGVGCFDDAMQARVAAKLMAERLGFTTTFVVKIATAVSELARN